MSLMGVSVFSESQINRLRIDRSRDMHKGKLKMELKSLTSSAVTMVRTRRIITSYACSQVYAAKLPL